MPSIIARPILVTAVLALAASAGAATPSSDLLKCQKTIHARVRSFVNTTQTALLTCARKVEECKLAEEIDAVPAATCLSSASTSCDASSAKIATLEGVFAGRANVACGLIPLADLNEFVGGLGFFNVSDACSAATASDLVTCLFADARCAAERTVFRLDPRAQDSLTAGGIAGAHPCVAP